jgi:hypothetical protein
MTEWLSEKWIAEALICIAIGFVLAGLFCKIADLLDRDQ